MVTIALDRLAGDELLAGHAQVHVDLARGGQARGHQREGDDHPEAVHQAGPVEYPGGGVNAAVRRGRAPSVWPGTR